MSAWELSMRALPMVLAADPTSHSNALELLEQAMEQAARDPCPMALAAWCHGLRAGHHFTTHPQRERDAALALALRASELGGNDPLADTMLAAALMLAHDLAAAEVHARRALAIDGGSTWGWGRLAWVHGYRGKTTRAMECCRIARTLGPTDPLGFAWAIGITGDQRCRTHRRGRKAWGPRRGIPGREPVTRQDFRWRLDILLNCR
jgi:adenylate cyclase